MKKQMSIFIGKFSRNRKKILPLLGILLLLVSLPLSAYFVTGNQDFDRRTEAAVFNALVSEMEELIDENFDYVPGMIRVEFPDNVSDEEIEEIIGRKRSVPQGLEDTPLERVEYINVGQSEMAWEMAKYERYVPKESVELNHTYEFFWRADGEKRALPNDWNASNHWYFNKVKLPEVWRLQGCLDGSDKCGGSKSAIVAVLDSGMAFNAPDVQGMNIWAHSSYSRASHNDRHGHGTYVAGVVASSTNNNTSSVGLAHNVTVIPFRISDSSGRLTDQLIERGLYYASEHGADVVNMSFGFYKCQTPPSSTISNALNYAYGRGVTLVAASGNDGLSCVGFPASHSRVIAVGSVNSNNTRSSYSQYGSALDFVAPVGAGTTAGSATWQQTFACVPNCGSGSNFNSFGNKYLRGTSFASPQVAAAVGLIKSLDPSLNPAQVKDVLIKTVDDIGTPGKDAQTGYGLLNLEKIYQYFNVTAGPSLTFTANPESVKVGERVTLTWSSKDASRCEASGGWSGVKGLSGNEAINPQSTTTYKLTCSEGTQRVERSVTVVVEGINLVFTAEPEVLKPEEKTTLTWSATGVSTCQATGGWLGSRLLVGSEEIVPIRTTTYTLSCFQSDRRIDRSVQIRVEVCTTNDECRREAPYEICYKNSCVRGDVMNTGNISASDFVQFKKDFLEFKTSGWSAELRKSDLNADFRISMADYSVFVSSYRFVTGLD